MTIKFKYKKIPLTVKNPLFGFSILRPIIPVQLFGNGEKINYEVLLDSGADTCVFDGSIGELLGLDVTAGTPIHFSGVQNAEAAKAYLHTVDLSLGGHKLSIPAIFSFDLSDRGYGILGQKGFFDIFSVKFDYQKEEIGLKQK
ncbi:MAG: aspartyl protease family protein [Patescibacteria group bacterium]